MTDFTSALPTTDQVLSHQEGGGYAMATVAMQDEETDGTALLRQEEQGWVLLSRVGGTFSASDLHRLGVPAEVWNRLLIQPITEGQKEEVLSSGPGWLFTEDCLLEDDQLQGLTAWELLLMRSEILARHGCVFQDPPLANYYDSRSWYSPEANFSQAQLSATEVANLAKLDAAFRPNP